MCMIQNWSLISFAFIILCCLLSMRLFQHTLISNILKLMQIVFHGYGGRSMVFYVSLINNHMNTQDVSFELFDYWNIHWKNSSE